MTKISTAPIPEGWSILPNKHNPGPRFNSYDEYAKCIEALVEIAEGARDVRYDWVEKLLRDFKWIEPVWGEDRVWRLTEAGRDKLGKAITQQEIGVDFGKEDARADACLLLLRDIG